MRLIVAAAVFSLVSCAAADAKPRHAPAAAKPAPPPPPELFVDPADAAEALRAIAEAKVAEIRREAILGVLKHKYGIDAERGDGWDPQPDGRLKVRRSDPAPQRSVP